MFSQEEECLFDQNTQTDEFVKSVSEFKEYTWDDGLKEATIQLKNGHTLVAHRGGCLHFGISGTLYMKGSNPNSQDLEYWLDEAKWIAKKLFSDSDYKVLKESIDNHTFKNVSDQSGTYILIPHKTYDEFLITIRTVKETKVLYIGYFF